MYDEVHTSYIDMWHVHMSIYQELPGKKDSIPD